ncbi:MAG TPA: hypothetical protein VFS36_01290 [Chitinophagaceae bacterium]|jgi:hypothetical protein|nr:hypothetical protein [Chitinophagaceae bacterium]
MKRMFYKLMFSIILVGGLFIGMVRGQEVRHRWVAKMKSRYEENESHEQLNRGDNKLLLDEFEMSAYHS